MKKLFAEIRHGNIEAVRIILDRKPGLVKCVAKSPPKKDDGQSPLQVAIKTGNFEIAHYLLDLGADVNFIESEDCINKWRMPVLQDAIRAAVMNVRFVRLGHSAEAPLRYFNSKEKADSAFQLFQRILELGAEINCHDSYSNSCLSRAILDARQLLPSYSYSEQKVVSDQPITDDLSSDLSRIFDLLFKYGADINEHHLLFGYTLYNHYLVEPVSEFYSKIRMK